jgi:hypothetical protein
MKKFFLIITILTGIKSYSQSITNVASSQQGNNAVVTYDLNGTTGTTYYVKLYYSTDGGQSFSNELMHVTGDVKNGIKTGTNKRITWAAEKEVNYLNGPVVFKVEAEARKASAIPTTVGNVTVNVAKATRVGDELTVEFTLTQNKEVEVVEYMLLNTSRLTTQDGQQYEPISGKFGTKKMMRVKCTMNFMLIVLKVFPLKGFLHLKLMATILYFPD